jgi:hypothetical protein
MRLEAPSVSAFHFLANAGDAARVHHIMCERSILDEPLKMRLVDSVLDRAG